VRVPSLPLVTAVLSVAACTRSVALPTVFPVEILWIRTSPRQNVLSWWCLDIRRVSRHDMDGYFAAFLHSFAVRCDVTQPSDRPQRQKSRDAARPKRKRSLSPASLGEEFLADQRLAERCLWGDVSAWEEIYSQCHQPLCASISALLGSRSDLNLVDEIAARVWYALVAGDGALLGKYDCRRAGGSRLITFLRTLARNETSRYFRSEQRRRKREIDKWQKGGQARTHGGEAQSEGESCSAAEMSEFLEGLTPTAREFFHEYLVACDPANSALAGPTVRQRRRRLRLKLLDYLHHGE
jgi:DNA-directed RNA polymerase specialized sigma24 family protein